MPVECSSTAVKYQWRQVHELDTALATMRRYGIPETAEAYQTLYRQRGTLIAKIGYKFPTATNLIGSVAGLSPGVIKVWYHNESGWMSEARAKPGAPPVYKRVSDVIAMAILKKELTLEQEKELLTPVEYYGE